MLVDIVEALLVELVVIEDGRAGGVRRGQDMQRAAPVEQTGEEGTADLFFEVMAATAFVVSDKAERLAFEGVGTGTTNRPVLDVGVVMEEHLERWRGGGAVLQIEPLNLALVVDDSAVREVDGELAAQYLVHVFKDRFDERGLRGDVGGAVLGLPPGLAVAGRDTELVEVVPNLQAGGDGRLAVAVGGDEDVNLGLALGRLVQVLDLSLV